jgi:hypothetical protein
VWVKRKGRRIQAKPAPLAGSLSARDILPESVP